MKRTSPLPLFFIFLLVPALVAAEGSSPSEIAAQLSPAGLSFVAAEVPRHLPRTFKAEGFTNQLVNCPFTDHDTDLTVSDLHSSVQIKSLYIWPRANRLTVRVTVSVSGTASLKVTRPYGCVGYPLTCSTSFTVSHAVAEASFKPVLRQGKVRLEKPGFELHLSKKNVSIEVSKCGFAGTLANLVLPLFKGYIVKRSVEDLEGMVLDQVPPQLEPILSGLTEVSGDLPGFTVSGTLTSLATRERGIEAGARLAITPTSQGSCTLSQAPAPEEPTTVASIGSHTEHLGVALNRIALEKAALAVWRGGNLCGDASELRDLGLPHQLPAWGSFLIGLSGGASLAVHAHEPPQVELLPGEGARARLTLPEVALVIDGTSASGPTRITATATARTELQLRVNPDTRAVVLDVLAAEVSDLSLAATDPTGLRLNKSVASVLIKSLVMPLVDQQLSGMEVVPQVLHDGAGPLDPYYLYLARGRTSSEYLYLYANVFRQPDHDSAPPRTWLATEESDQSLVRLVARGSDDKTPDGMLRFRWRVDSGQWTAPGYAPTLSVSLEVGEHVVEAAAVDINGNADPTPARIAIKVTPGGVGKGDLVGWTEEEGGSGGGCGVLGVGSSGSHAPLLMLLLLLLLLVPLYCTTSFARSVCCSVSLSRHQPK